MKINTALLINDPPRAKDGGARDKLTGDWMAASPDAARTILL